MFDVDAVSEISGRVDGRSHAIDITVVAVITATTASRVRDLPSRVVVYLLLAGGLFAGLGYRQVWARMVCGLGAGVAALTSSALMQARRRIGAGPLRELFGFLAGPTAGAVRWRGCWYARSTRPRCISPTARPTGPSTASMVLATQWPATRCCGYSPS
ncbi:transposase domain-containing protein [Nocardia australiensis]|uniref:transposase domain-containing protein n=1 Tax=Nocardia australiensis TaxID=2887191 RepID=UPI001D142FC7